MEVQIIGNGNAFGELLKYHTCFFLQTDKTKLLVDCGATSIHNLQNNEIDCRKIDLIVLSHYHGDHFGGVPFFLLNSYFFLDRTRPLTIIGPKKCETRIKSLVNSLYPGLMEQFCEMGLTFLDLDDSNPIIFQDLKIEGLPVIHSPESNPYGLRITNGNKIFCYSGDTEWTDNLYLLSDNADLFICECNYFLKEVSGHLSYNVLKEKLKSGTAKRTILTHFGEDLVSHQSEVSHELSEQNKFYIL